MRSLALHYALIGERLGYRPNGFFDPDFFRQSAGLGSGTGGLLGLYLASGAADGPSPSAEFDQAWYAAENPGWAVTHPHPFLHFLEVGLASGRRPRPDIDMTFVRDVVRGRGRSIEEAAMRVFDPKPRDGAMKPPLSRRGAQRAAESLLCGGASSHRTRGAGPGTASGSFSSSAARASMRAISPGRATTTCCSIATRTQTPASGADAVVFQAGTKTTAIRRLLDERPDLLLRYEAVLFLDDDVEIGGGDIDALFAAAEQEGLDLAQPALTADSDSAWPFLKRPQAGSGIIRVSTVEIMAPLITRRALERVGWAFSQSVSGWGTDLVLGPAARAAFGPAAVGVVGSVAVRHARPVDTAGRRLLRLSATIRHRSGSRGQSRRRRLWRRATPAPAQSRRGGTDLRDASGRAALIVRMRQPGAPASSSSSIGASPKREHSRKMRSGHRPQSS